MTSKGDLHMSYWQFMQHFYGSDSPVFDKYTSGIFPHIDVNHLWYLRELWTFSLVVLCLSPVLNSRIVQSGLDFLVGKTGLLGMYVLPILPLLVISAVFADDKQPIGFTFLIYGYLIGWNENYWQKIKQFRRIFLLIAFITYLAILAAYFIVWLTPALKALWWAKYLGLIVNFNAWSAVLALLGYAAVYLNKSSAKLSYLNDAVLPYYILHQSLIIVLAFWLSAWHLGPIIEPILIIVGTMMGCILSYEIIRRIAFLRPLFGLKWTSANTVTLTEKIPISFRVRNALVYLILLPFALLILIESPFT
jgi:glucan biosynthesis protein C